MKNDFKSLFKIPSGKFLEPIDLMDVQVGFSLYTTSDNPEFKSLFRVYIKNEELDSQKSLKSVTATASYGKQTQDLNGILLSSNEYKRKLNWPIDLISEGDFFYDIQKNKLYYKDKNINGIELLEIVYSWHIKTTRPLGGFWVRSKLLWFHTIKPGFWKFIFQIVAIIQYLVSGEKIKIFHSLSNPHSYQYQSIDIKESELINLWGYKVKPWIAGTYAFLHLFGYSTLYYYNYKPTLLVTIFKIDFLTFMYGIVSLGLANTFLPILFSPIDLKGVLKSLQSIFWNSAIRKVKI